MRRIIVVLALTFSFSIGLMAGLSNNEAKAFSVCQFAACYPTAKGIMVRWVCCQDTVTGQITCSQTTSGCVQGPIFY